MRALVSSFLPLTVAAILVACSDPSEPPNPKEPTAAGVAEMQGTSSAPLRGELWVTLRHGAPGTAAPPDADLWLHLVDRAHADVHVDRIDLTEAGLDGVPDGVVLDAPDDEVVLHGVLEQNVVLRPGELGAAFAATAAYRGMPGRMWTTADVFERSRHPLGVAGVAITGPIDLSPAEAPWLDRAWLENRVWEHGAIVAGHYSFSTASPAVPTFVASQVFVLLPDREGACPPVSSLTYQCPSNEAYTYARDVDRCLVPTGCARPMLCTMMLPMCQSGYVLRSWREQPGTCPGYACDPAFLSP